MPWIAKHNRARERDPDGLQPEARLYWLLYGTYSSFNMNMQFNVCSNCDSRAFTIDRAVWLCLDKSRTSTCSLDCADDIFRLNCNCQCELAEMVQFL